MTQKSKKVVDLRNVTPKRPETPKRPIHSNLLKPHPPREEQKKKSKQRTPLKQRRAYKRRGMFYAAVSFVVLACVGLGMLSFNPAFVINSVVVEGVTSVPPGLLQSRILGELAGTKGIFFSGNNIITAQLAPVEAHILSEYPRFKQVELSRYGINTLMLRVVERQPFALWCTGEVSGTCYHVDDTGFIYEETTDPELQPIIVGGITDPSKPTSSTILGERFGAIKKYIDMAKHLNLTLDHVVISEDGMDARLSPESGPDIIVLVDDVPDVVERMLKTAFASPTLRDRLADVAYIDIRFGNRLYYKFIEAAEPTQAEQVQPQAQ